MRQVATSSPSTSLTVTRSDAGQVTIEISEGEWFATATVQIGDLVNALVESPERVA